MAEKRVRIGIVGAHWALSGHAPAWRMLPGAEVVAICTAHRETAEAAANRSGIGKAYWDYREMIADPEIDLVDLGANPAVRYSMAVQALEAGKHVHDAVPFAVDLPQARHLRDLQRARGLVGLVDSQLIWTPAFRRMKELIAAGTLGEFYHATLNIQTPLSRHGGFAYPYAAWSNNDSSHLWLGDKSSGGSAWRNYGAHALITLGHLFGEIEEIVGRTETYLKTWNLPDGSSVIPQTDDFGAALVRFKNGGLATIRTSWCTPDAEVVHLEAVGSRARMVLRDHSLGRDPFVPLFVGEANATILPETTGGFVPLPPHLYEVPGVAVGSDNAPRVIFPFLAMFDHALRAIATCGEATPSFNDALMAQRGVEGLYVSAASRTWVRLTELG